MIDYLLRFPDEATATAALFDGEAPKYSAVDVIGTIYKPTGKMLKTDEGPVPEMKPVAGWHANVRHTEEAPELDKWAVVPVPDTPERVWF